MKKRITSIVILLLANSAYACPELNLVDMADGDSLPVYRTLSSKKITLTEEEFYSMPKMSRSHLYRDCKEHMILTTIQHKISGRKFKAITSTDDDCDGGNAAGALYSENLIVRLADIGDSYIYCYE